VRALLLAMVLAAAVAVSPLTNEDVVRWVAAGKPQAEILNEIASRPPAFDVSDDMLAELRLAGVPEPVIAPSRRTRISGNGAAWNQPASLASSTGRSLQASTVSSVGRERPTPTLKQR